MIIDNASLQDLLALATEIARTERVPITHALRDAMQRWPSLQVDARQSAGMPTARRVKRRRTQAWQAAERQGHRSTVVYASPLHGAHIMGYDNELSYDDPNEDFAVVTIFDGLAPAAAQTHLFSTHCACDGCRTAFREYIAPACYGEQPDPEGTVMPGPVVW